jgi:thiamine kinase-like enzyme
VQSDGRERLFFIEGDVAVPGYPRWAQSAKALDSITRLMRAFHEASARVEIGAGTWSEELADPDGGSMVCHNDVCLENVVFRGGEAVGLVDFDFAAPGRPAYDLAAFARMCVPIDDERSAERLGWFPADRPARLRLLATAYDLNDSGRQELLEHLDRSMERGGAFVQHRVEAGDPNFIRMLEEMGGIGRYERRRGWWEANRRDYIAALS